MPSTLAQKILKNLEERGYLRDGVSVKTIFDQLNELENNSIAKHDFEEACSELDREGLLADYKPISQPLAKFPLGTIKLKARPK